MFYLKQCFEINIMILSLHYYHIIGMTSLSFSKLSIHPSVCTIIVYLTGHSIMAQLDVQHEVNSMLECLWCLFYTTCT